MRLVKTGKPDLEGERLRRPPQHGRGLRQHPGGIDPAAEIGNDRNVGAQAAFDRLLEEPGIFLHRGAAAPILLPGIGKVDFPIDLLLYLGAFPAQIDTQEMTGLELPHARKAGDRSRIGKKRECLVDAADVRFGIDHARGQQCLDLGTEDQEPAAFDLAYRPVKRANAEPVPCNHHLVPGGVVKGDRELAPEALEHALGMFLPHMRQEFGIAARAELVALALKLALALGIVEELAVEHGVNRRILIGDGLLPVGKAHDAQPARAEPYPRLGVEPFLVGSAMGDRIGHILDDEVICAGAAIETYNSYNAAHLLCLFPGGWRSRRG